MKTIITLFKPVIELAFVLLPGLVLLVLGAVWWMRRQSRMGRGDRQEPPCSPGT